jgi:plasmid stabilization system protein ParE
MSAPFQLTTHYIIVYRPESRPLQVIAILHGNGDLKETLKGRLPEKP